MRFKEAAAKLISRVVEYPANLAIFIDSMIVDIGRRVFAILPHKSQENLRRLNGTYKLHRNRLLGIEVDQNPDSRGPFGYESINANQQVSEKRSQICDVEMREIEKERALQRGDVPGWVLVVLMTTGLVTALWTIAAPRLSQILKNSLDSMNNVR